MEPCLGHVAKQGPLDVPEHPARESMHRVYADTIYSHDADTLWVNLFIPSELKWQAMGVTIRQETGLPLNNICGTSGAERKS
ncbi:MAG: glycoside hydrolase family 127 protein [Verrucomicrobia bacterium]|nr:glycoside hydrolase family 127 protein [Verrucomicrobiota bacterium]